MTGELEPTVYYYDDAEHCPACTFARFGHLDQEWLEKLEDSNGGQLVGFGYEDSEWYDWSKADQDQTLECADCGTVIAEYEGTDEVGPRHYWYSRAYGITLLGKTSGKPEAVKVSRITNSAANDEKAVTEAKSRLGWAGLEILHDFKVTEGSRVVRPWAEADSQSICDSCTVFEAGSAISRFARYRAPSEPVAPEGTCEGDRES